MSNITFKHYANNIGEIFDRLEIPSKAQEQHLSDLGSVSTVAILDWLGNFRLIKSASVEFLPNNRFEFTTLAQGNSVPALIIEARNQTDEVVDLVAFRSNGQWALLFGAVSVLGLEEVLAPRLDEHLVVHRTILDYVIAGRKGCVILEPAKARIALECAGALLAYDEEHGEYLLRSLTHQPKVLVPAPQAREADQ